MRRRSRSLMPPQMPNFSPLARAYSRHSRRTTQPRHTSFASRVDAPRSGKKRSGSTPRQLAWSCQLRSNTSILRTTRSIGGPPLVSATATDVITTVSSDHALVAERKGKRTTCHENPRKEGDVHAYVDCSAHRGHSGRHHRPG